MISPLYTYSDAINSLLDWTGSASTDAVTYRKVKRAVESAYRDITNIRRWGYYMTRGSTDTVASYNTGTVAIVSSTGVVTLTGGTFPSWAANGVLQVASIDYEVASRDSSTQLTLSVNSRPTADVAAGSTYNLLRDAYPLPVDLVEIGTIKDQTYGYTLQWMEPNDFMAQRITNTTTGTPYWFTITADPHYVGSMALRFYPPPSTVFHYGYMYHRRPRTLTTPTYTTGTITSSGTTVTGSGTTWTSSMIGCVLRNSVNGTATPTGTEGSNPFVEQRIITAFTSATSVTIDSAFTSDISTAAKYEISDPIDLEAGAMYSAFLRKCELELGLLQRRDDTPQLNQLYYSTLHTAMEADNRSLDRKPAGTRYWRRVPLYYDIVNAQG